MIGGPLYASQRGVQSLKKNNYFTKHYYQSGLCNKHGRNERFLCIIWGTFLKECLKWGWTHFPKIKERPRVAYPWRCTYTRSQASAAVELNYSVFWVITQCRLVYNWRFGTTYQSHLQKSSCPRRRPGNWRKFCWHPELGCGGRTVGNEEWHCGPYRAGERRARNWVWLSSFEIFQIFGGDME